MCTRYVFTDPAEAIRDLFRITAPLPNWPPSYNVAPTHIMVRRRFLANRGISTRFLNGVRAITSNRAQYQAKIRRLLDKDVPIRRFIEGESRELPKFYENRVRESLGPLWEALPEGALMHDQNAYLKSQGEVSAEPRANLRRPRVAAEQIAALA